jgi:four helix bundle protein
MTYLKSFKELIVWQKGIELAKQTYRLTEQFPRSEVYGLVSQMRRAAVSIPSNIAEGKQRKTIKDFVQFLRMADGSAAELETQIIIAKDRYKHLNYIIVEDLLEEVQKMLNAMIRRLENPSS